MFGCFTFSKRKWLKGALKKIGSGLIAIGLCFGPTPRVDSEAMGFGWTVEAVAQACPTPEALAEFLHQHIRFSEDWVSMGVEDYWRRPEEFLAQGEGDCEDYALLSEEVLRRLGWEAFTFSLYGQGGYAHTVCVFRDGFSYSVVNQDRVMHLKARSLEELAGRLYPQWSWGAVAKRHGTRGQAVGRILKRR